MWKHWYQQQRTSSIKHRAGFDIWVGLTEEGIKRGKHHFDMIAFKDYDITKPLLYIYCFFKDGVLFTRKSATYNLTIN